MKIDRGILQRISPQSEPKSTTDQAGRQSSGRATFTPGQQVRGEVLARLSDQVYLIRIAGELHRTELPLSLRPGDPLDLTFRTADPRPSFSMRDATFDSSPVRLSPAASWLNNAMKDAPDTGRLFQARFFAPLMDSRPGDPAHLASLLQHSLARSGLFYESHLLQWLMGEKRLSEILKEPQAGLSRMRGSLKGERVSDRSATDLLIEETATPEPSPHLRDPATGANDALTGRESASSVSIIREQMALLLSGMVRLRGEVWKDQEMEWDVERGRDGPERDEDRTWRTSIRLRLPNLGSVNATLTFNDGCINGELKTESTASMEFMKKELETLEGNMSDSGLRLRAMVIEREKKG